MEKVKNPKVSVIIPVYNGERTLRACLHSVLNQTCKNYEVIAVDNNSNDRTKEIIKDFQAKHRRLKYIFEQKKGRGAARNAGIMKSKGEIIAMTDADCIVPVDWLEKITMPIIKNNENAAIGSEANFSKDYCSKQIQRQNQEFRNARCDGKYINYFDTKNCAFKKDVLSRIGMFNPMLKNSEDSEFGMKILLEKINIYYLRDCYVKHIHNMALHAWMTQQADRAYWLDKAFRLHRQEMSRLPMPSYNQMGAKEFFFFFPDALVSMIFGKQKKDIFFNVMTGMGYRIGIVKSGLKWK